MIVHRLRNLGNTCFLNSTLQSLLNLSCLKTVLESFKDPKPDVISYLIYITELKVSTTLTPTVVYDTYLNLSHNKQYSQEDSVECLMFFLQFLEENCSLFLQPEDNMCLCSDFWYSETKNSIFHVYFSCMIYTKMKCMSCEKSKQLFELFKILPLYIEESSSIKESLIHTLYSKEIIDNVHCEFCDKTCSYEKSQNFHKLPKVFFFELIGENTKFSFDTIISMDFTHGSCIQKLTYVLKNIIFYNNSHYYCIACDYKTNSFLLIDDERITQPSNIQSSIRMLVYESI